MLTCIYHKNSFAHAHAEHILQNFLGARWKSTSIICDELQTQFGRTIDLALDQGLMFLRVLLGSRTGRGGGGPTIKGLRVGSGETIDLEPGGRPRLAEPVLDVRPLDDGRHRVRIRAGTMEQFRWGIAELRQRFPEADLDMERLVEESQSGTEYLTNRVSAEMGLGGKEYFRGMLKSCMNLVGARCPEAVLQPAFDAIRAFVLLGEGRASDFVRWPDETEPLSLPRLGEFDHFIGIVSRNGMVEGVAQFFGCVVHVFRLAAGFWGPTIHCGYLVDPTREVNPAEHRNPSFEPEAIPRFDDLPPEPHQQAWDAFAKRLDRVLAAVNRRAETDVLNEIVQEVLGPLDGRPVSGEMVNKLASRVAEWFVSHHRQAGMDRPRD